MIMFIMKKAFGALGHLSGATAPQFGPTLRVYASGPQTFSAAVLLTHPFATNISDVA